MDYEQNQTKPTIASEPICAYETDLEQVSAAVLEEDCLTLDESKKRLLQMVHRHYHPTE